jgi:hypothetical protein
MDLLCCEAVPSDGLCFVLRFTYTKIKHVAQAELSSYMPLCRCKSEESHSLGSVPRNAAYTIEAAHANNKLPKAAARRLALTSQRKPSRIICGNTMSPNGRCAEDVAAAECALAVRAAQRRTIRSKSKRSLPVLGHAWSAPNQHIRQVRVRGRVLQQRRPPPALRRLAEAPLPVQPLPLLKHALRLILVRPQEMAPRRHVLRELEPLPHAAFALQAQQPRHKCRQQRSSAQHSPQLLLPNVDASDVPVRRVRWQRRATEEHGAPALDVELGGQAVHGMRREVLKELMPRSSSSRVRQDTRYKRAHAHAPAPAALPAHEVHATKISVAHGGA